MKGGRIGLTFFFGAAMGVAVGYAAAKLEDGMAEKKPPAVVTEHRDPRLR